MEVKTKEHGDIINQLLKILTPTQWQDLSEYKGLATFASSFSQKLKLLDLFTIGESLSIKDNVLSKGSVFKYTYYKYGKEVKVIQERRQRNEREKITAKGSKANET